MTGDGVGVGIVMVECLREICHSYVIVLEQLHPCQQVLAMVDAFGETDVVLTVTNSSYEFVPAAAVQLLEQVRQHDTGD